MKDKTLDPMKRRYDEADERQDAEGSVERLEPPRYVIRVRPETATSDTLTLGEWALLSQFPRSYEWTVVPGPDMPQ